MSHHLRTRLLVQARLAEVRAQFYKRRPGLSDAEPGSLRGDQMVHEEVARARDAELFKVGSRLVFRDTPSNVSLPYIVEGYLHCALSKAEKTTRSLQKLCFRPTVEEDRNRTAFFSNIDHTDK